MSHCYQAAPLAALMLIWIMLHACVRVLDAAGTLGMSTKLHASASASAMGGGAAFAVAMMVTMCMMRHRKLSKRLVTRKRARGTWSTRNSMVG